MEDEFSLADVIADRLEKEKYSVDIAVTGEEGLYQALMGIYDLIILDVMLPGIDGFEILRKIRSNNIESKVIMLTAKSMLEDKLLGFNKGADDYLTKPFHMEELVARVFVQLRKEHLNNSKYVLQVGDLLLDKKTSKLICETTGEAVEVRKKEFLLIECLMYNWKQIISREQIYDKVWGLDNEAISNNLEAYLSFLRKKLKIIGSSVTIKAIRGLGYKLEVCDEEIKK